MYRFIVDVQAALAVRIVIVKLLMPQPSNRENMFTPKVFGKMHTNIFVSFSLEFIELPANNPSKWLGICMMPVVGVGVSG